MSSTNSVVSALFASGITAAAIFSWKLYNRKRHRSVDLTHISQLCTSDWSTKQGERENFLKVFECLTEQVISEVHSQYDMPQAAIDWIRRMINYNVPHGKLNRGLTVLHSVRLIKGSELSVEEKIRASIIGWCVEWLQGFFLVADDVMDSSITRRGQPCWFRLPEVQLIAVNDSFLLQSHIYRILHKYFKHDPFYMELVEIFTEVTYQTELGQLLDLTSQPQDELIDLDRFTLERYRLIVKYKTAFYSFYLPIASSLIISGVRNQSVFEVSRKICLEMGEYFQIQDDYLDCFGDPEFIGKVGTDIEDNKCSWLIVQALARANKEQKELLKANYARKDPKCVAQVKQLYRELALESVFTDFEDKSYEFQCELIGQAPKQYRALFTSLLEKIYKRSK